MCEFEICICQPEGWMMDQGLYYTPFNVLFATLRCILNLGLDGYVLYTVCIQFS